MTPATHRRASQTFSQEAFEGPPSLGGEAMYGKGLYSVLRTLAQPISFLLSFSFVSLSFSISSGGPPLWKRTPHGFTEDCWTAGRGEDIWSCVRNPAAAVQLGNIIELPTHTLEAVEMANGLDQQRNGANDPMGSGDMVGHLRLPQKTSH